MLQRNPYPGLRYHKNREAWVISRVIAGKTKYYGQFSTEEKAVNKYKELEEAGEFDGALRKFKNKIIKNADGVLHVDISCPICHDAVMLIDEDDWNKLQEKYYSRVGAAFYNGKRYAQKRGADGVVRLVHRLILDDPAGGVDHIDGNGFNNTRNNLRLCTQEQNLWNKRKTSNKTGYKGVWKRKTGNKRYCAEIVHKGKKIRLGSYLTPEEAAAVYDAKALELRGEYHAPNGVTNVNTEGRGVYDNE